MFGFLKRPPDFTISPDGAPYLRRWHLLPPNRYFNVYLHHTLADDNPAAIHDHPYANVSIVLKGGYWEYTPRYWPMYPDLVPEVFQEANLVRRWRGPGSVIFRRAHSPHRLALKDNTPSWSLFVCGPRRRKWGFWTADGWVPYDQYVTVQDGVSKIKPRSMQ